MTPQESNMLDRFEEKLDSVCEKVNRISTALTGDEYEREGLIDCVNKNTVFRRKQTSINWVIGAVATIGLMLASFFNQIKSMFNG